MHNGSGEELEQEGKEACLHCYPLFLLDYFLRDGHSKDTPNATATFIRRNNTVCAVTCQHVIEQLAEERQRRGSPNIVPCLMVDRAVLPFARFEGLPPDGLKVTFKQARCESSSMTPDVALAEMGSWWSLMVKKKNRMLIDLDSWSEPDWRSIRWCIAVGCPNEHKDHFDDKVSTPIVSVIAEASAALASTSSEFVISGRTNDPHNFYFSGLSGGAVFGVTKLGVIVPIGIAYEAIPGGSKGWAQRDERSFADHSDIMVICYRLTPSIFDAWLAV